NPRYYNFIDHVARNNTPENFEKALRMAKDYLDRHPEQHKLMTINSWNEWTETSYLEPDNVNGYGYLEAVKRVFGE
ncbi:MAG: glycoside hydrolase family 99-like domain-containing protein, partial [Clostridia bacterium]|nr:glycoside hydrolase family 99-like domain-containing protein [Clostridia bacterium]